MIWAFQTNYLQTFEFLITKSGIVPSLPITFPQGAEVDQVPSNCVNGSLGPLGEVTVPDNFGELIKGVLDTEGDVICRNELSLDLLEWIGLAALSSPRLLPSDRVDPYICMPILQGIDKKVAEVYTSDCSGMISALCVELALNNLQYVISFLTTQSTTRG